MKTRQQKVQPPLEQSAAAKKESASMSQVLSVRLADEAAEEVKRIARRERRSASEVTGRAVEEWLRMERFPLIEFRSLSGDRQACLKGRLPVWQVLLVGKAHGMDVERTVEHLQLKGEQVRSAFDYYAAFPEEIDGLLEDNRQAPERLKRFFPNLDVVTVTDEMLDKVEMGSGAARGAEGGPGEAR
jgi:hypothetical protein